MAMSSVSCSRDPRCSLRYVLSAESYKQYLPAIPACLSWSREPSTVPGRDCPDPCSLLTFKSSASLAAQGLMSFLETRGKKNCLWASNETGNTSQLSGVYICGVFMTSEVSSGLASARLTAQTFKLLVSVWWMSAVHEVYIREMWSLA